MQTHAASEKTSHASLVRKKKLGPFFAPTFIQPKLTIGPVDDPYEREADAMAETVMRMPDGEAALRLPSTMTIQRKCAACEEEEKLQRKEDEEEMPLQMKSLQRKCAHCEEEEKKNMPLQLKALAGLAIQKKCAECEKEDEEVHRKESANGIPAVTPSVQQTLRSTGHGLDTETRSFMEQRFGYDFGHVQIHNDSLAHQSSTDIRAKAYTHGHHIVFGAGHYQPESHAGKELLAHELTHVVQQNAGSIERKTDHAAEGLIQRAYTFGPAPRPRGEDIHAAVLPDFVSQSKNSDLFVEVSIPGANKKDVDTGLVGVADLYISDVTNGKQRTIGIKFENDEPRNLKRNNRFQYAGSSYDHNTESAPRGDTKKPRVRRIDDAPRKIWLGDLKPGGSSESFFYGAQLTNYRDGIVKTAKSLGQYLTGEPSQSDSIQTPKKLKWNISEGDIMPIAKNLEIPEKAKYGKGKGYYITKNLAVYDGKILKVNPLNISGGMFVYKNPTLPGIWSYEWIPYKLPDKTSSSEAAINISQRLKTEVIPSLNRKPAPKPVTAPKEQPPKFNYDEWNKNIYTPWHDDAKKVITDKEFMKEGAVASALVGLNERVPGQQFNIDKETTETSRSHKKIDLWYSEGRNFGRLRRILGPFYSKIVSVLGKISAKIKSFFGKGKTDDEEIEGGSIIKKVAATAFSVIKKFAVIIFQRVAQGMKDSLVRGIKNIIKELFTDVLGEEFLSVVEEIKDAIDKIENFAEDSFLKPFEDWISGAMQIMDMINEVKGFLSDVDSIVTKVKWAIRAIQCVSPPAVGCIKLLLTSLTEKLIEMAINSCWFQEEVYLPIFNKIDFLKKLPDRIAGALVGIANDIIPLPSFIKSPLFADIPDVPTGMEKDDLPCNDEQRINKINLAFAKLEGKYTKEKVQLLLDILKKRGVGEKTELDLHAIDLLDNALHELESVNDATLLMIQDDTPDKQNATPTALDEFVQNVKDIDKSLFPLDEVGGTLDRWYFVAHLPIESDGRIAVTVSDLKPCKDWHPLMKIKIKARQTFSDPPKKGTTKIHFTALETITFNLGGEKTINEGQDFWAFQPDRCSKLKAPAKDKNIMRKESGKGTSATTSAVDQVLRSKGHSIDTGTRTFMEQRFGNDFSHVQIHDDTMAHQSSSDINALAYTHGSHIVFGEGRYQPGTDDGKKLLAHELTHVVQQAGSNNALLQRDDIGRLDVPEFGDIELEDNCPKGPTQLGKVQPDPPCKVDKTEVDDKNWEPFKFCVGSDIFLDKKSPDKLKKFARERPALAKFVVHTYASKEGNQKENENLSCHRARRVARELINAGVPPEQIEVVGKGITEKFGSQLQDNRVVVINTDLKEVPGLPELDEDASNQDIIDKARGVLASGHYRLAADAYISFWTCGQIPTLRDAVRRVEITAGTRPPPDKNKPDTSKGGVAFEEKEFNQIVLFQEVFDTADPLNCIIARIIDLTFHHMALPHISDFHERHIGGLFLVELAGFLPCHDPLFPPGPGEPKLLGNPWWTRPDKDPLRNLQPFPIGCNSSRLPGAQGSDKGHPRLGHSPVKFDIRDSSFKPAKDSKNVINWKFDLNKNKAEIGFGDLFSLNANVSVAGDPSEFLNYEVGFIRTILSDESTIAYVNGFQYHLNSPAPLLDAQPDAPAPWPRTDFKKPPSSNGTDVSLDLSDSPNPKKIEFPYAIAADPPHTIDPLKENIVNFITRDIRFGIWLITRRKDSPLDFADIQFLDGTVISFSQIADIVNTNATGQSDMKIEDPLAPGNLSRLNGPIPADFHEQATGALSSSKLGDKRIVSRDLPSDRDKPEANALSKKEYEKQLGIIAEPIRKEMGLTQKMEVNVLLDKKTGRLWVPAKVEGLERILPIQVKPTREETEYVPKDVLDKFSERLFFEARKELALEKVPVPPTRANLSFETATVFLDSLGTRPASFQHMHTRPGIKGEMKELWRLTEKDKLENEWSSTIMFDRQTNQIVLPPERVQGGTLKKTDSGLEARVDICAKKKFPTIHQTVLGTIHTHPLFDPVDQEGPSGHDKEVAGFSETLGREERFVCGIDHYIVGIEHVFRFDSNGVAEDLGDRRDVLGI